MQIFNLGLGEILFIALIAVIVLGPERIVASSRRVGRFVRGAVSSPVWRDILATSHELREIPNHLMEESGLRDDLKDIQYSISDAGADVSRELTGARDELSHMEATSFTSAGAGRLNELPAPAAPVRELPAG